MADCAVIKENCRARAVLSPNLSRWMMVYVKALPLFSHICLGFAKEYCACPRMIRWVKFHVHIVDVLPVADVLQVAAGVLPADVLVRPVGLQPGVGISPQLGAGGHAAGGGVPHASADHSTDDGEESAECAPCVRCQGWVLAGHLRGPIPLDQEPLMVDPARRHLPGWLMINQIPY